MLTEGPALDLGAIPEELLGERAWCVWAREDRDGKATKVPRRPDGSTWRSNDPATWATFDEVATAYTRDFPRWAGIGRRITGDLVGVDVDWKRAEAVPAEGPPWLADFLAALASWTEITPSGRGAHVWLRGEWRGRARQVALDPPGCGIEVYDHASPRFFTLTGATWPGSVETIHTGAEAQAALDALAQRLERIIRPAAGDRATSAEGELPGAVQGRRRAVLTTEAGRLRALGVSRAEAEAVLLAVAAKCKPAVPPEHVAEILAWAWTKPAGEPRACPVCDRPEPCPEHPAAPPPGKAAPPEGPRVTWLRDALREADHELDKFHAGDLSDYISTGIISLDHKLGGGLRRRQVVLLGAPTGGGKTTLLMTLAMAAAERGPVLFVTPEMAAVELALREIVRTSRVMKWARRPWSPRPEAERDSAAAAHARASSALLARDVPLAFMDQPAVTMADIEDAARRLSREHGALSLVIVDYAQEVADTDPRTPRYLTVGNVASRSIALAEELQAAVVIASQVNVVREGAEETFVMRESAILKHKAHFYLELAVEWDKLPDGTRRVKGARIRCPKARNGPAFELPIRYRPELYLVTDEVPA